MQSLDLITIHTSYDVIGVDMTMIAGFFLKNGCPILMGDVLVSDNDKSDREFVFPTVGKVSKSDLSNGEYSPSDLCQKVILVSPKLAISWAGTKYYAGCFINDIIKSNCHNNPSYELLLDIYNEKDGYGDISAICLYRNGTEMRIFDFNSLPVYCPNPEFDYFSAAGSGYLKLLDIIDNIEMETTSGRPNKFEMGIGTSMVLSTSLLSQEIINPLSLRELFGVGYEVVHPLKAELSKFTDLTYVFWIVEEEKNGSWRIPTCPFLTFKYSYQGDILIIRSVRTSSKTKTNACIFDSDELTAIPPVHKDLDPDELIGYSPPSLNSKWMCNIFIWKNQHGKMGTCNSFSHYASQPPPIIWSNESSKNKNICIDSEFVKNAFLQQMALPGN